MGPWRGLRRLGVVHRVRRCERSCARALWVALAIAAVLAIETACTSARPALSLFFEGVPPEGQQSTLVEVARPPRREPYKKPDRPRPVTDLGEARQAIDWAGRYAELPRSDAGEVAWMKALEAKLITPLPGLAPDAKDEDPTDMDVELVPEGQPEYKVVFSHKVHTSWMGCPSCHTGIFEMEKGKTKMTMAQVNDGAYCGVCHGKVASPDVSGCPACHTAMGK